MDTQNTSRQLRYLEEVRIPLHRAGFGTLPLEGEQLPALWNGAPLCRITGKGSVFYRREDVDTPQAEDALYRVEDIAAKTLEYMTAMEAAPQLKASGLDGDYRILADFGATVLADTPSKYGVQFVTWDWDYDRTGVVHGHYFMENYDGAKQDFATRSGLIQKEQLFSPEQLTEIFRCCADSVDEDFFELTDMEKLGAAVMLAEPKSAAQIKNLAESLDLFDFAPGAHTPQEYGKYMIQQSGRFEYDENLDAFYDYEKYGTERMNAEDGMFTDRGYIAYKGYYNMEEVMNGSQSSHMEMGGLSR